MPDTKADYSLSLLEMLIAKRPTRKARNQPPPLGEDSRRLVRTQPPRPAKFTFHARRSPPDYAAFLQTTEQLVSLARVVQQPPPLPLGREARL